MAWYDFDNFGRIMRFGIKSKKGTINGQPALLEIDSFSLSDTKKTYFKKDEDFVKIQSENYVASNVIGKSARRLSNAVFSDTSGKETKLLEKIKNPNKDQTQEEFLKEFTVFILAAGWTAIYINWKSYPNFDTMQLVNLNPDLTQVKKKTVCTVIDDKELEIDKNDVLIFYDMMNICEIGSSRLIPLKTQLDNIKLSQIAKGIQITNSGTTIVSPKSTQNSNNIDEGLDAPVPSLAMKGTKTQKQEMEDRLNYRGMKNRIIVSNKGLDAVNLSEKLNDVDFFDIVEEDILSVYDAYGYPVELTPYGKNAKFENRPAAETQLIEDEIYPLANSLISSLNEEFSEYGEITVSYNHLLSVSTTKLLIHDSNTKIINNYLTLFQEGVITLKEYKDLLIKHKVI